MQLAYQGLHVAVLLLMGANLLARSFAGRLQPQARATLDNTLPMWHCASVQGVAGLLLVQALPRLLG
jgi:cytochrome c oxidase subunit I+III